MLSLMEKRRNSSARKENCPRGGGGGDLLLGDGGSTLAVRGFLLTGGSSGSSLALAFRAGRSRTGVRAGACGTLGPCGAIPNIACEPNIYALSLFPQVRKERHRGTNDCLAVSCIDHCCVQTPQQGTTKVGKSGRPYLWHQESLVR